MSRELKLAGQTFEGSTAGELVGDAKPELHGGSEACNHGGVLVQRYRLVIGPATAVLVTLPE